MASCRSFACLTAIALTLSTGAVQAETTRDPAAVAVAKRTLDAMGGSGGFEKLRTLKFDFVVVRGTVEAGRWRHVWDRWDGRYRLEGKDKAGRSLIILFNVNERGRGRALADGKELSGDELEAALERGYGRFINDTYWLLMPAKMLDPGVNLAYEGEQRSDGKTFDVVKLSFDNVGLTPQDTYWAFVAKDTGLMERWDFVLTGQKPEERSRFAWTDWTQEGPVRLALVKTAPDGGFAIRFENVSGSESAENAAFETP
jgi:hypothetical protein